MQHVKTCLILIAISFGISCTIAETAEDRVSSRIALRHVPGDENISKALGVVDKQPEEPAAYVELASAYIKAARYTGDFSLNTAARDALTMALSLRPDEPSALRLKASLHLTFHEFAEALAAGERLAASGPADSFVLGVITDAHTQLGNYPLAVESAQKMVDLKPNAQSYARVAILRGLHGDTDGAVEMFKLAARTADPADAEAKAWTLTQLGDLYWRNGKFEDADKAYSEALSILPAYPNAMFGKGRAIASKGDLNGGRQLIAGAIERSPHTYSIIYLGDVIAKMGDPASAEKLYKLADSTETLGETHDPHRIALHWADRGMNLDQALEIAKADYADLKDIYAADILAWCLFKKGRFTEAREKSDEALRIGTKDAVLFYHAGMIENALGNRKKAKQLLSTAVTLNPAFDLIQTETASRTLKHLLD